MQPKLLWVACPDRMITGSPVAVGRGTGSQHGTGVGVSTGGLALASGPSAWRMSSHRPAELPWLAGGLMSPSRDRVDYNVLACLNRDCSLSRRRELLAVGFRASSGRWSTGPLLELIAVQGM